MIDIVNRYFTYGTATRKDAVDRRNTAMEEERCASITSTRGPCVRSEAGWSTDVVACLRAPAWYVIAC
jgi:hypothetical protein